MRNSLFRRFVMAAMVAVLAILVLSSSTLANSLQVGSRQVEASYTFTTLNNNSDPTFNQLLGINIHGVIAGYYGNGASGHPNQGYTLSPPYGQGNYTNENYPGSVQTQVTAINNHGYTAGFWIDGSGNNFGFVDWNGVFTSYKNPHTGKGTVNQLLGLNDNGRAVGFYTDGHGINHAYQLDRNNGQFYPLAPPNAISAVATGINEIGDIVGFLTTQDGSIVGFLLRGKTYREFEFPNSTNTTPFGVNYFDQIVGGYVDSAGKMHGFLLSNPSHQVHWKSIDDPNGVGTTIINGLNYYADLVGFYVDSSGNTDGFIASKM